MELMAQEGRNCWRRVWAARVAFLHDAGPYFEAFAAAAERAQRSILVVGWDIDSRVELRRGEAAGPRTLAEILAAAIARRPRLEVRLLGWDYALIYAFEREWLPLFDLAPRRHPRLRFQLDDRHPPGASHHQKLAVFDDALAFAGGIDLTAHRWDTPRHEPDDPLRVDARGEPYGPFHDVQLAVAGPAARALGELARERWRRATGQRVEPVGHGLADPWPSGLRPDLEGVEVAIARTQPAWEGQPEAREVERLYLDTIAAARRWIYLENQYLTSSSIRDALARRLSEPEGPEVLIVGPRRASGWLENGTMDVVRGRVLAELRRADRHGRLRACFPQLGAGEEAVYVHSKVAVVDGTLLRIGSANLSNRSMYLDTECDLQLEGGAGSSTAAAIERFLAGLLAEHLGHDLTPIARRLGQGESPLRIVESLRGRSARELVPIALEVPDWLERTIPEVPPFDPPGPVEPEVLFAQLVPLEARRGARRPILTGGLLLAGALLLAAAWRWSGLRELLGPAALLELSTRVPGGWLEPLVAVGAFTAGAMLLVPLSLLIAATAFVFGPLGFLYSAAGALGSAALTFSVGRHLGRNTVRRIAGAWLNPISLGLARGGILDVVAVRMLPLAPYTIVNLIAGASRLRRWELLVGTAIGVLPGLVLLTVLGDRVRALMQAPGAWTGAVVGGLALVVASLAIAANLWLRKSSRSQQTRLGNAARRATGEPVTSGAPQGREPRQPSENGA